MPSVALDVRAVYDAMKRATRTQPNPNQVLGERQRHMLQEITEAAAFVEERPILAGLVILSMEEARLLTPYLEFDGIS